MSDLLPRRFGKYQILQKLGAGAMGIVYLGYDPAIQRRVAVKTIRKEGLPPELVAGATERFRREAMAAGRLNHPGIVAVYDYGEDQDIAYIVMEYAPGLELRTYASQYALSLPQIGALMSELLDALGYAHAAGVVHRDVKPGNILISDRLKITDFGIARVDNASLTRTGVAAGTPAYMAPEQFMGKAIDHRVDLFAAGVILYELLTRSPPFGGQSLEELCYKICHTEPIAATALNPELPPALDAVLARALAKPRDVRFSNAAEFSWALNEAIAGPHAELRGHAAPAHGTPAPTGHSAHSAWGPDLLQALEGVLAPVIGSLAGAVVRRSASRASHPAELLRLLGESIAGEPQRHALLEQLRVVLGEPSPPTPRADPASVTPEAVARVSAALASYVGPIAKVMTQKTAAQTSTYLDLCLRLSERLGSEDEKARFLKDVGVSGRGPRSA
jgi:serine/threonine protein kinase